MKEVKRNWLMNSRCFVALLGLAVFCAMGGTFTHAQDKPPASVDDIITCVKAKTCRNAVPAKINWADVGGISVLTFNDAGTVYALALSSDGSLTIWVTLVGEPRPGRRIKVGDHGRVLTAELGPQPGERFPMRIMSPELAAEKRELRKAYRSKEIADDIGAWGEKYQSFWQEQANAAVAAIRRQIAK